jgi:glycosyltransferase involved in cell wall biosynthesis
MRAAGLARGLGLSPVRCREFDDLPQRALHERLARCRVYLHPYRWTSLGLSLIEAMHLAMPVVAVAATEVPLAVPPAAGVVSSDVAALHNAIRRFIKDPAAARDAGAAARDAARARYGLGRFLRDWDEVLRDTCEAGGAGENRAGLRAVGSGSRACTDQGKGGCHAKDQERSAT